MLAGEFERDPARGAYPGEPAPDHDPISHLELVARCDAYCIAPASANTIAKLAAGHRRQPADGRLPRLSQPGACVAPAMNNRMYEHPATQANLDAAAEPRRACDRAGHRARSPRAGSGGSAGSPSRLSCSPRSSSRPGTGAPRPLDGLRVLVTAGGTREPIDSVRFVGNRSSGRMGFALAAEAARRGARGHGGRRERRRLPRRPRCRRIGRRDRGASSGARRSSDFADADVLLMAAAVADFRPAHPQRGEDREGGHEALDARAGARPPTSCRGSRRAADPARSLVGFAAEHGAGARRRAPATKLERKGLDAIVVNDISRAEIGFDSDENEVTIVDRGGRAPRRARVEGRGAAAMLDFVQELRTIARDPAGAPPMSVHDLPPDPASDDAYALFQRGLSLLADRHWAQAAVSLEKAKRLEPDKTSIREALGRAYFRSGRYRQRRERVLGGRRAQPGERLRPLLPRPLASEARRPPRGARGTCRSRAGMRPDRADYRLYRDRGRAPSRQRSCAL